MSPLVDPAAFTSAHSRGEAILLMVLGTVLIIMGALLGVITSQWFTGVMAVLLGALGGWTGVVLNREITKRRRRA